MEELVPPPPNPWRSMWLSPRLTIRQLLQTETRPSWVPVVALAAVSLAFMDIQVDSDGSVSLSRSAMPFMLSVLKTVGFVLVGPFVLAIVGGWFGSDADPSDIREAVAWSDVPPAAAAVLWIPVLLGSGTAVFGADELPLESAGQWLGALAGFGIAVSFLWSIVLLIAGLAEAQRLPVFKTLLTLLIPVIPLLVLQALT